MALPSSPRLGIACSDQPKVNAEDLVLQQAGNGDD